MFNLFVVNLAGFYRVGFSRCEAQIGLERVDELEKLIDGSETWEGVIGRINWLMDTLSPVAGVIFVSPVLD